MRASPSLVLSTLVVLVAFAGNSLLCRLALIEERIDPVSFTALRLLSGSLVLLPFVLRGRRAQVARPLEWRPALALFVYALGFSLAYVSLPAGTGALLLFGTVQATMIGAGWLAGERPTPLRALGILLALVGLVVLVLPGVGAPDLPGTLWMVAAGAGWGSYSLLGRGVADATRSTGRAFLLAAPFAALAVLALPVELRVEGEGAALAAASGALTSGLGYALWYRTLRHHTATSAAIVQLAVPVIASAGGSLLLNESITPRLVGAGALTLGGVALALVAGSRR